MLAGSQGLAGTSQPLIRTVPQNVMQKILIGMLSQGMIIYLLLIISFLVLVPSPSFFSVIAPTVIAVPCASTIGVLKMSGKFSWSPKWLSTFHVAIGS